MITHHYVDVLWYRLVCVVRRIGSFFLGLDSPSSLTLAKAIRPRAKRPQRAKDALPFGLQERADHTAPFATSAIHYFCKRCSYLGSAPFSLDPTHRKTCMMMVAHGY